MKRTVFALVCILSLGAAAYAEETTTTTTTTTETPEKPVKKKSTKSAKAVKAAKAAQAKAEADKAAAEQAAQEQAAQAEAAKQQALQEQAAKMQGTQAAKDQVAHDQATKDQATREQTIREQATQEQAAKDRAAQEEAAKKEADSKKGPWSGGAEINANLTSGNTDIKTLGASAELGFKSDPLNTTLSAGFFRNATDQVERARQIHARLRTGMNVTNNLDFFAQGAYHQNKFSGIDAEYLGEAGLGIYAFNNEVTHLRVEGGLGYMAETYFPTGATDQFIVGTVGLGYLLKISAVADIVDDFLYTDNLKNPSDWRLTNSAGLVSHLTNFLSLKVSYDVRYRKLPVAGYQDTDTATIAALIFRL